jgi:DNA mismatch repair protein MutS
MLTLSNSAIYQLNLDDPVNKMSGNTILSIVDKTQTAMGRRLLRTRLVEPIFNISLLQDRYDEIEFWKDKQTCELKGILDIERLYRKIVRQTLSPRELWSLINTILKSKTILENVETNKPLVDQIDQMISNMKTIIDFDIIEQMADINNLYRNIFNVGINDRLDKKQKRYDDCTNLVEKELDVFNNYVSETLSESDSKYGVLKWTDADLDYITLSLIRYNKITLNDKRKLTDYEVKKLKSEVKIWSTTIKNLSREKASIREMFRNLVKTEYLSFLSNLNNDYGQLINIIANEIAKIDVAVSSGIHAEENKCVRPVLEEREYSYIKADQLRHPLVESMRNEIYVPNDIELGKGGLLIYGTNACGKSTLMRSIGVAVIMAQAGLYVSAQNMVLSPYHTIFTRIWGNDNIIRGDSSFVVEMKELRGIIKNSNEYSLVLGDEVCRGTEQTSGLAIVAASIRHLSKRNASFLFATHLHQLANLEQIQVLDNVEHYHLKVNVLTDGTIEYDRKLTLGSGSALYGIEVMKSIIDESDFIKDAVDIRGEQDIKPISKLVQSLYNSNLIAKECAICGSKPEHTHHINEQQDADSKGFIDHFHKNTLSNLVMLCQDCHIKIHQGKLDVNKKSTSNGVKIEKKIKTKSS